MTLENSTLSPQGNGHENITVGYLLRPKSILKLRENATMPIASNSDRRVSFYNQVELRQFEFTSETISSDDFDRLRGDALSSEFDENPDSNQENAHEEHFHQLTNSNADQEDVHQEDESMELTGQLSVASLKEITVTQTALGTFGDIINTATAESTVPIGTIEGSTSNKQLKTDVGNKSKQYSGSTSIAGPLFDSVVAPSRRLSRSLNDNEDTNISFTMSPYLERQVLFVPSMTQENVRPEPPKLDAFKPLETLQDYADSLRDSLFNDTGNSSHEEIEENKLRRGKTAHFDAEEDMELTEHAPAFSTAWTEEVTMELTTQVAPFQLKTSETEENTEETMELTQPVNGLVGVDPRTLGQEEKNEQTKFPVSETILDHEAITHSRPTHEGSMEIAERDILNSQTELNNQSDLKNEPNHLQKEQNDSLSDKSESFNRIDSTADQEESIMDLTSIHQPQELHMLSVVEEEEEEEETEVPMEITKPVDVAPMQKSLSSPSDSTLPQRQSRKFSNSNLLNVTDQQEEGTTVDPPASLAAEQELKELVDEPTSPHISDRPVGTLGTPMQKPKLPRNLEELLPEKDFANGLSFTLVPEFRASLPAKRSLDPPVELETSPSKRVSIEPKSIKEMRIISKVSLAEFLEEIDVKFFDDLEFAIDLLSDSRYEGESKATFSNESYFRANIQVPLLELYELSCKELTAKIEQGKNLYLELQETADQDVPELFSKYFKASYYEQMAMKSQFQVTRVYTREQAKQVWYEWRAKVFRNVIEVFAANLTILRDDKLILETSIHDLTQEYEALQDDLAQVRNDILLFEKIRERYKQKGAEEVKTIKTRLMELNGKLLKHKESLSHEHKSLAEVNKRIAEQTRAAADVRTKIEGAKTTLLKLKRFNQEEIQSLQIQSLIIQACAGLRFMRSRGPNIFEFDFHPKMKITVDMDKADSADGLVFHPIDSATRILFNSSLERYCQALAETTPFLDIFKTLALFRAKWLRLLQLDRQIYALSTNYPLEIGEFNENQISFTFQYLSSLPKLKIQYTVSIPLRNILRYDVAVLVTAKVLKTQQKATQLLVQNAICKSSATHTLFAHVKEVRL